MSLVGSCDRTVVREVRNEVQVARKTNIDLTAASLNPAFVPIYVIILCSC